MSFKRSLCLGGSIIATALAMGGAAYAQDETAVGEVIVTATRRAENVQDVAMNVTPITGQALADYNIVNFEDIETLTPGLSIGPTAEGPVVQLRGVSFSTFSSSAPAVDLYVNEVPVDANNVFQTIFDIGQIEVLRGPQGTLRGRPAPVGAITVTTRRPDMDEYGVYGAATASDQHAKNLEAGVNIPLIEDVFAVRLAGVYDESSTGISNALTGDLSRRKTTAYRGTAMYRPTENLEFILTHQHLDSNFSSYEQLEGDGPNGPPVTPGDRMGVIEGPQLNGQGHDLTWLNASWDVIGHRLSYIGAYHKLTNGGDSLDNDPGNGTVGNPRQRGNLSTYWHHTHEVRFETEGPDRLLDYTVGAFYSNLETITSVFTSPTQTAPAFFLPIATEEKAGFGNATLHLGRTDFSAGVRYSEVTRSDTNLGCQLVGPFVPAFCNPGQTPADPRQEKTTKGWVYNATVTHHFTDDMMAYATYGRSRRPGVPTVAQFTVNPQTFQFTCSELACGAPVEISDSYEIGMKSTWRDGNVRFNAAAYHIDFENYVGRQRNIPYVDFSRFTFFPNLVNPNGQFNARGPAVVDGIEADLWIRVNEDFDFQVTAQTADGHWDDAFIPCRDGNFDGVPDDNVNANPFVYPVEGLAGCRVSTAISQVPNWSMTFQGEYRHDVLGHEGYVRALMNYEPDNGNVRPGTAFVREARTIVDLHVGLRSEAGWDASIWAKNLLDQDTILDRDSSNIINQQGVNTGYRRVSTEEPREIGVTLRHKFGAG